MFLVCRLVNGLALNTILSASWDKSVKVWSLSPTGSQCLLTIRGHQQAVWAVLHTTSDFIVTGSADKIIKVHKNDGSLIRTLTGSLINRKIQEVKAILCYCENTFTKESEYIIEKK